MISPGYNLPNTQYEICQRQISELLSQLADSAIVGLNIKLFLTDQYAIYKQLLQQLDSEEA
jgi:hypothetical protein